MPIIVDTPQALRALCDRLVQEPVVAVDTEFLWERTYYPILGLVQVATADRSCWLIDTVALKDLTPFGAVLAAPEVVKILHDAHQDLTILHHATGAFPKRIFDTRLAAGFAGISSVLSLKSLLITTLDVHLEKSETRSDWTRRPLDPKQVEYAADDVLYLPALRDALIEGCFTEETRGWQTEEMAEFDDEEQYREKDPDEAWLKVKGLHLLRPEQMPVVKALAAWRERMARLRDRPRGFIIADPVLVELAIRQPKSVTTFYEIRKTGSHIPSDEVKEALELIRKASAEKVEPLPQRHMPYSRAELKQLEDELLGKIARRCEALGVDPALVASRKDAGHWILASEEERERLPMAKGWRRGIVDG